VAHVAYEVPGLRESGREKEKERKRKREREREKERYKEMLKIEI
jgi:hypothetical protein